VKQRYICVLGAAVTMIAAAANAHTVWLEQVAGAKADYRLLFGGHAGKIESYKPEKLKSVESLDAQGRKLTVTRAVGDDGVRIHVAGTPALLAMHFDNGIHSRTQTGPSVEKPMNELPGATRGTYAVKYHKTVAAWSPLVTKPIGQPFELVPLDAKAPTAGEPVKVKVLMDGKPVAGVKLGRGEEGPNDPVTDDDGIGSFVPERGFNRIWAGKRNPVAGNAQYTELSYEYSLGFTAE
jgi:nickel transport protein